MIPLFAGTGEKRNRSKRSKLDAQICKIID